MTLQNTSANGGTPVVLATCAGTPEQGWSSQSSFAGGPLTIYGGTRCMDASGGAGNVGDQIIIWGCEGSPNQVWTRNAAGEFVGINGLCIGIVGGDAVGSGLALATCTGTTTQLWDTSPSVAAASPSAATWVAAVTSPVRFGASPAFKEVQQ
jgi:alpha-galactosidase